MNIEVEFAEDSNGIFYHINNIPNERKDFVIFKKGILHSFISTSLHNSPIIVGMVIVDDVFYKIGYKLLKIKNPIPYYMIKEK